MSRRQFKFVRNSVSLCSEYSDTDSAEEEENPVRQVFVSVNVITKLLVNAIKSKCFKSNGNHLDPDWECRAIVKALTYYVEKVNPGEIGCLFDEKPSRMEYNVKKRKSDMSCIDSTVVSGKEDVSGVSSEGESLFCGENMPETPPQTPSPRRGGRGRGRRISFKRPREVKIGKSWEYVAGLDTELRKRITTMKGQDEFRKKMAYIMQSSLEVDPFAWEICQIGYILGFWIAKLYEGQYPDTLDDSYLPENIRFLKGNFLEVYGNEYEDAAVLLDRDLKEEEME